MSRFLIKEIHLWPVARTVFPLAWIVSFLVILGSFLLVGRIISDLVAEFTDTPIFDLSTGILAGTAMGIILGFLNAIVITVLAIITIAVYNFLANLGGGFTVSLSDEVAEVERLVSVGETAEKEGIEGP